MKILLALLLLAFSAARSLAADVTIVGRQAGDVVYGDGEFRLPVRNAGTAAISGIEVYNATTAVWGATTNTRNFESSGVSTPAGTPLTYGDVYLAGSASSLAAGSTRYLTLRVRFGGYNMYSYTAGFSETFGVRVTFVGGVQRDASVTVSLTLAGTFSSSATPSMTPNPWSAPEVVFSNATPPSSVGIFGWTGAETFLEIEGPTLSNVFLLAKVGQAYDYPGIDSDAVPDGSVYYAKMPDGGPVVGSGVVAKEPDGHFTLLILVTPPPATGAIGVVGRPETAGAATLTIAGGGTYEITIPASGAVNTEIPNPNDVPDGAAITVTKNGQVIGQGNVHKDSGGSFAELILTSGEGDEEQPDKNDAVFELEVVSYEDGETTFELEIGGQTFTPEGGGELTGDPVNGARKTFRVRVPNGEGNISGDDFRWKATGLRDGQVVTGQTVAQGQAPLVPVGFTPDGEVGGIDDAPVNGFRDTQTVTMGTPRPTGSTPPAANPYTPTAPEQIAQYQADRKASGDGMKDALKVSGQFGGDGNPSTAQGEAAGKLTSAGNKALGDLAAGAGSALGGVGGVAPFSAVATTLSVTLPILGVVTFDSSIYGGWAGILRLILLAMLVWNATIGGLSIVRGGFAGR